MDPCTSFQMPLSRHSRLDLESLTKKSNMSLSKDIKNRILLLDGAMGTMIQRKGLSGNSEQLNLTHPSVIAEIHREYIEAGACLIEANTFGANRIAQAEYGLSESAAGMALAGARIARAVADEYNSMFNGADGGTPEAGDDTSKPCSCRVYVAGSVGPTSKSLTLAPDISDPSLRPYSFDEMASAYKEQMEALIDGGVDVILIETCFDALNTKAALYALAVISDERGFSEPFPAIVSVSVSDRSGRTLTGQTIEAFYNSVRHYPLTAFGINCSLGAEDMIPIVREISSYCEFPVICYPNAGLPNELGGYDETPSEMAAHVARMAGSVNIVGGCCGTGPEHIKAIASVLGLSGMGASDSGWRQALGTVAPREIPLRSKFLKASGLEAVDVDLKTRNFANVGERTNVAGSRKFARLIASGDYETALQIAAQQIENGASIIDINMDDAMLDSTVEMEKFVRWTQNDPAVAKAALMIDSSHWETILAGLKNAQGKCIVNSISLKDGEASFLEKAREIRRLGAAVVVMAFDEEGQATSYERKVSIAARAYKLLISLGFEPQDIIFDVNILSVGTGIAEHSRYGVDFIEAVRWIKANLQGVRTSGGVSNLSFAFRGNNTVREAMHSVFLYHAIAAGLDMAIMNPGMVRVYDEIEPSLRQAVEDVIFDRDEGATERLIVLAQEIMAAVAAASDTASGNATVCTSAELNPQERLSEALVKGRTAGLSEAVLECLGELGSAVAVIEGPLMAGMEKVGELFAAGKMFLPQVVKSAKVMRDAVAVLEPYMDVSEGDSSEGGLVDTALDGKFSDSSPERGLPGLVPEEVCPKGETVSYAGKSGGRYSSRPVIVNATVKGDVHDIGKNITGIVLSCNGFEVVDLGVMVDKETILDAAVEHGAVIVGASGLITPSLFQMEELCREMNSRGLSIPLFIGGATTSALHTAVKLAPLYDHVFYSPDASASAVMAKRYMMDPFSFELEEHAKQQQLRYLHAAKNSRPAGVCNFAPEDFLHENPFENLPAFTIPLEELEPLFDWRMFLAMWGVKYGSEIPDNPEITKTLEDGKRVLETMRSGAEVWVSMRFFDAYSVDNELVALNEPLSPDGVSLTGGLSLSDGMSLSDGLSLTGGMPSGDLRIPMMRQEEGEGLSLCDFVPSRELGFKSPFGIFALSVKRISHAEGCACESCRNEYEGMMDRAVRVCLAEAASQWIDVQLDRQLELCRENPADTDFADRKSRLNATGSAEMDRLTDIGGNAEWETEGHFRIIKPAVGYSSCPDHTLKKDILALLPDSERLGISLTESFAMIPDASICGFIFFHKKATYPEIRHISREQYTRYASLRAFSEADAHRFLGHLL